MRLFNVSSALVDETFSDLSVAMRSFVALVWPYDISGNQSTANNRLTRMSFNRQRAGALMFNLSVTHPPCPSLVVRRLIIDFYALYIVGISERNVDGK